MREDVSMQSQTVKLDKICHTNCWLKACLFEWNQILKNGKKCVLINLRVRNVFLFKWLKLKKQK